MIDSLLTAVVSVRIQLNKFYAGLDLKSAVLIVFSSTCSICRQCVPHVCVCVVVSVLDSILLG